MDYRQWMLVFIRSLTLADHMGDVADDIDRLFSGIGFECPKWSTLDELAEILGNMGIPYMHEIKQK